MIDPIAVGMIKEYVLKCEKNDSNPTIWLIGAIDSMEKSAILSASIKVSEDKDGNPVIEKKDNSLNDFKIVKYGLKGWRNFGTLEYRTEEEQFFDRKVQVVPDDLIKRIDLMYIYELSAAIWSGNHVDENLAKN